MNKKEPTPISTYLGRQYTNEALGVMRAGLVAIRKALIEHRNEVMYCQCCESEVWDVVTSYPKESVLEILGMAMMYSRKTGAHEFTLKELQDVVGRKLSHTAYANINHFVRFGGIMYRPLDPKTGAPYKSGHFGINIERARAFFKGAYQAPIQEVRNRLTDERTYTKASIKDFPSIASFIDEEGNYNPFTNL